MPLLDGEEVYVIYGVYALVASILNCYAITIEQQRVAIRMKILTGTCKTKIFQPKVTQYTQQGEARQMQYA